MKIEQIKLTAVRTDGGTQARSGLNQDTITEYADAMRRGDKFPPIILFYDGTDYWPGDGFHRLAAKKEADGSASTIEANVHQGTRRDAVLFAAGANADHGLRRTADDKRRAVETLLRDEEWGRWSDREISRKCKVSHPFVAKVRADVTGNVSSEDRVYITKHGTEATMKTAKIGNAAATDSQVHAWLATYEDGGGRTWRDLSDNQVHHANSPCFQAFVKEFPSLNQPKYRLKKALTELRKEARVYINKPVIDQVMKEVQSYEEEMEEEFAFTVPFDAQAPQIREALERWAKSGAERYESIIVTLANKQASGHDYKMNLAVNALGISHVLIWHAAMALAHGLPNTNKQVFLVIKQLRDLGHTVEATEAPDLLRWSIDGGDWLDGEQAWAFLKNILDGEQAAVFTTPRYLSIPELEMATRGWLMRLHPGSIDARHKRLLEIKGTSGDAYMTLLERYIPEAFANTEPKPTYKKNDLRQAANNVCDQLRQVIAQREADTELLSHRTAVTEMRVCLQRFGMELRVIARKCPDNEGVALGAEQLSSSIELLERELKRSLRSGGDEEE